MNMTKSFIALILVLSTMALTPQVKAEEWRVNQYNKNDPNVPSLDSLKGTMTGTAAFGTPEQRGKLPEDQRVEVCDTCVTLQNRSDADIIEPWAPVPGSSGPDNGTGNSGGFDKGP